jgi:hypothetical protein
MAAIALPLALILGMLAELISGLLGWALGGEKRWWRGVSGIGPDATRLLRDREPDRRVTIVEAGGAAAALLGAGLAAAGAVDVGPDGLVLLYLALALAFAGTTAVRSAQEDRRPWIGVALADVALAVGLGTMFLRYGALELGAVRGTQDILGTGLVLGPVATAVGLAAAAKAFAWAVAINLPRPAGDAEKAAGAAVAILLRLCRWSAVGAASLVAGVLLAGGGLDPIADARPLGLAALGFAAGLGIADAILGRIAPRWQPALGAFALVLGAGAAALVVLS